MVSKSILKQLKKRGIAPEKFEDQLENYLTGFPYLKIADNEHLSRDDMGQKLLYADKYVVCENASYLVKNVADDSIITTIEVPQNEKGIDTEDRVQTLKTQLALI